MPRRSLPLLALLLLAPTLLARAGVQYGVPEPTPLFDDTRLPSISLEIDADDWAAILAPGNEYSDEEFPARFTFDDGTRTETVENVGVRLRGNTSRVSAKKSIKVSFNTFVPGRAFYGLEKLNLNGEHNDPSIIRAKLAWDLFAALGVPASRAAHVRLHVNGEYRGLYLNVEHIDERFLQSRFGNDSGSLYKCLWPASLTYQGANADAYRPGDDRRPYDLKLKNDANGYDDLAHFIDVLNTTSDAAFPQAIENVLDVNLALKVLAVDVATGSWDDYWYNQNNFYLYFEPTTERFLLIPYDYDNTFGIWWDGIEPNVDWGTRDVYRWGRADDRPLANRLLAVPAFRERFTFYLHELLGGPFTTDALFPRIDALHDRIRTAAEDDTYRTLDYGFTVDDFNRSYTEKLGDHVTYGLKPYVETRRTSALGQLDAVDVAPILSHVQHTPRRPQTGEPVTVTALIEDDDAVALTLLYEADRTVEVPMADDGQHGDGAANDGIYGAVIPAFDEAARVFYLIEARDADGRVSTSRRGQFEAGYAAPAIYINEFMASNTSTLQDPQGKYADWLELYNGGTETVNLGGYYMSDRFEEPDRWELPDVTMQPGEFLILWMDDDERDGPLHASFNLDQMGEQIGLFDPSLAPVDTLTYGRQTPNVSYGRVPDGTGPFGFMTATPGASNGSGTDTDDGTRLPEVLTLSAPYPNPFRTSTAVAFTLPAPSHVTIEVFDVLGRRVRRLADGTFPGATHVLRWDGTNERGVPAAPGLYVVRLTTPTHAASHPVVHTP